MQKFTIRDFDHKFPDDDACLDWLMNHRYPNGVFCKNCQKVAKHHRVSSRKSYSCDYCGNHVHPTADTICHKSRTPLKLWFYSTYLMASTGAGVSAIHLQRELGVTYKTAWRMFTQIRKLLSEDIDPLGGKAEADESNFGGRAS